MANLIQIKRSLNTAAPTSLANGEMAYTANGDVLAIGSNGGIVYIGGKRDPGTLTANQALVANSTSGIDQIKVGNLAFTGTTQTISANGGVGTAGYVLASGATGNVYWLNPATLTTSPAGTNTQVEFNDSGAFGASAGFTFDKAANNLFVANSVLTTTVNAASHTVGTSFTANATLVNAAAINIVGQTNTATLYATTSANVGANVQANTTAYFVAANSTVNTIITATSITQANTTATPLIANSTGIYHTGVVNAASHTTTGVTANTSGVYPASNTVGTALGSATQRWVITANSISTTGTGAIGTTLSAGNTTVTGFVNATTSVNSALLSVGATFTANATLVNAAAINITGQVNTATFYATTSANVGANVQANTTAFIIASNSTVNAILTATTFRFANTTATPFVANTTGLYHTGTVNSASVTTTDLTVTGNTKLGDATSDVVTFIAAVNTSIMPSANATYNLGNNTIRWNEVHAANVHSQSGYFDGSVQISGDLFVSGNVTTTNVASVVISDPLIYLAGNNYSSDLVDIGFAGNYNTGLVNAHTGLFRDATDGVYKLFSGLTQELSGATTVNTADPTFAYATLQSYLIAGGFVSNATNVTITANSTLAVGITANTLSLSTALPATSGGTGLNTFTSGDLLVANTGNALSKLSVGTDGYVLQVSSGTVTWNTLDGGTF